MGLADLGSRQAHPSAAYMVSAMSLIKAVNFLVTRSTGWATCRRTGSPSLIISLRAILIGQCCPRPLLSQYMDTGLISTKTATSGATSFILSIFAAFRKVARSRPFRIICQRYLPHNRLKGQGTGPSTATSGSPRLRWIVPKCCWAPPPPAPPPPRKDHPHQIYNGRIGHLASKGDLPMVKAFIIVVLGCLDTIVLRVIGLDDHPARPITAPARPATWVSS